MAQTNIATPSNGATLPQTTINVVSTAGFASSGTLYIFSGVTTQVSSLSNGLSLPQQTISVNDTTFFAPSGSIIIIPDGYTSPQVIAYTKKLSNSFGKCSGGTGTLTTGVYVNQFPFIVNYTGITSTSFTGCTTSDTATLNTSYVVYEMPINSVAIDITNPIKQDIITHDPTLIENSVYDNALPTYYKIGGTYPATGAFETFVVIGAPTNVNPNNKHVLTNTKIMASWTGEKVTSNVSSS
jgi:hypothetical protein